MLAPQGFTLFGVHTIRAFELKSVLAAEGFTLFGAHTIRAATLFGKGAQRKHLGFFAGALRAPGCCFPLIPQGNPDIYRYNAATFRRRALRAGHWFTFSE